MTPQHNSVSEHRDRLHIKLTVSWNIQRHIVAQFDFGARAGILITWAIELATFPLFRCGRLVRGTLLVEHRRYSRYIKY